MTSEGAEAPRPLDRRGWDQDILGPGWSARTLRVGPGTDDVATLVRKDVTRRKTKGAVLYVHGFVDYFFQAHLGRAWSDRGYAFYAIDLRGYGRSIRPGQRPNDIHDLADYFTELDAAVDLIRAADHGPLIVLGHSTGGLTASLWADARAGAGGPDLLILNSPWLDLNGTWFERVLLTPLIRAVGRVLPALKVGGIDPYYGHWLHRDSGGEWEYNLAWKPHEGFPARAGFVRTVRRGHAAVKQGLAVPCPVLVCCSTESGPKDHEHPRLDRTDSVLDVDQIVARAPRLGKNVTLVQIEGGVHDLALSPHPARTKYFTASMHWADDEVARLTRS